MENIETLNGLQTREHQQILDTVDQIRRCGLQGILSLPQLVVCGNQSAGKSSVLEALTEIPFPREDNLCTRFATEIILRHSSKDSLTVKINPDPQRANAEQEVIRNFKHSIADFSELPSLIDKAKIKMGITSSDDGNAFSRDTLSIEIEGPGRPQLTVVDLPGIIHTETKNTKASDIALVMGLTEQYISSPRTICLAVTSATTDYASQVILRKVREYDPKGERTLGIITKPDRLDPGSGSEKAYLALARNEDIFFQLGWHVLRNRSFQDGDVTFHERNANEALFFQTSNFKTLPRDSLGVEELRKRLSQLLFEHIKRELPHLHSELTVALHASTSQLALLGATRADAKSCRAFMTDCSLKFHNICQAAVEGRYEGEFFRFTDKDEFNAHSKPAIRRLRALVQEMNSNFAKSINISGMLYNIEAITEPSPIPTPPRPQTSVTRGLNNPSPAHNSRVPAHSAYPTHMPKFGSPSSHRGGFNVSPAQHPKAQQSESASDVEKPTKMGHDAAIEWVRRGIKRGRGRELQGTYNPLLIGELFWEQSSKWPNMACDHIEAIHDKCTEFLQDVLNMVCPEDMRSRIWASIIQDKLKARFQAATEELAYLSKDLKSYPVNYNHYYTDTIKKRRLDRERTASDVGDEVHSDHVHHVNQYKGRGIDPDMEKYGCEEILDSLSSIYKVQLKTFIANVTTQVIERHIVSGLEGILSPLSVTGMSDEDLEALSCEPASVCRQRTFLQDRVSKLEKGAEILRRAIRNAPV